MAELEDQQDVDTTPDSDDDTETDAVKSGKVLAHTVHVHAKNGNVKVHPAGTAETPSLRKAITSDVWIKADA